jgi:hypothetical protein
VDDPGEWSAVEHDEYLVNLSAWLPKRRQSNIVLMVRKSKIVNRVDVRTSCGVHVIFAGLAPFGLQVDPLCKTGSSAWRRRPMLPLL